MNSFSFAPENDIASADPAVSQRGTERLLAAIAVARDLGSRHVGGPISQALAKHREPVTPKGRANTVRGLARCAEAAKASGIRLALEVVNRYESSFINTAAQAMDLLDAIGSDNLFVHLDTFHMGIEEASMADAIALCGDRLAYFEVGQNHRGRLGDGMVDLRTPFTALAKTGYDGPIGFEAFSAGDLHPSNVANLAIWRTMWNDADATAIEARQRIAAEWIAARDAASRGEHI